MTIVYETRRTRRVRRRSEWVFALLSFLLVPLNDSLHFSNRNCFVRELHIFVYGRTLCC